MILQGWTTSVQRIGKNFGFIWLKNGRTTCIMDVIHLLHIFIHIRQMVPPLFASAELMRSTELF